MFINKLAHGVLRVQTPLGPRHFQLSVLQRLYVCWIFRHFVTLPVKVLNPLQLRFIDGVCDSRRSISWLDPDAPVLGTLEQRPYVSAHNLPALRPESTEAASPLAANQNRS